MIMSPLNYPGNKTRIIKNLFEILPCNCGIFVDVFCGSGIVGLNSNANKIVLNDKSFIVINLLQYLRAQNSGDFLQKIHQVIDKYGLTDSKSKPKNFYKIYKHEGLSLYNKDGFLRLRDDYNKNPSELLLFVLIVFGFNHYIRFNAKGNFNVPVGKMDFTNSLEKKTIDFIESIKQLNVEFCRLDFRDERLYKSGDFFYFDPPYLITNAPYNATWGQKDEMELLEMLDFLNKNGKKFALSNVIISNGKINNVLETWAKKYKIYEIHRRYANANYRRRNLSETQEVLILN